MAGLFVASTAMQMYGQYKSGKNQASLLQQEAEFNRIEAAEIINRMEINNDLLFREAHEFQGTQVASMASAGGGMSASRMQILMETATRASEQASRNAREAQWEAQAKLIGAGSKERSAGQVEQAGVLGAAATGAGAGFQYYQAKGGGAAKKGK